VAINFLIVFELKPVIIVEYLLKYILVVRYLATVMVDNFNKGCNATQFAEFILIVVYRAAANYSPAIIRNVLLAHYSNSIKLWQQQHLNRFAIRRMYCYY
jgi:hypothetical protein